MSSTTNNYKLMGFFEILTIIFTVAKLLGYFNYSWWMVFAPVILHAAIVIVVLVIIFLFAIIKTWLG